MPPKSPQRRAAKKPSSLALKGELTIVEVDGFVSQATTALLAHPEGFTIDCRGLTYVDAAALQALASLRVEAERRSVAVHVTNVADCVLNDAQLLGMSKILASEHAFAEEP